MDLKGRAGPILSWVCINNINCRCNWELLFIRSKVSIAIWTHCSDQRLSRTQDQTANMYDDSCSAFKVTWFGMLCNNREFYVVRKTHKEWETRLRIIRLYTNALNFFLNYWNTWTFQIFFTRAQRESIHWGSSQTTRCKLCFYPVLRMSTTQTNPDKTIKKLLLPAQEVASEGEKQMQEKKLRIS